MFLDSNEFAAAMQTLVALEFDASFMVSVDLEEFVNGVRRRSNVDWVSLFKKSIPTVRTLLNFIF
jgi:hypothetical protein